MNKYLLTPLIITCFLYCSVLSCNSNNTENYTPNQYAAVRDSVQLMAESIARDLSRKGPLVWLTYFENTPGFFMASEGRLVFPNYDSATNFIKNTLVKNVGKINLHWSNIRVDPLTNKLAGISANFYETLTDYANKQMPIDGYLAGTTQQTPQGWKLRNAHWSLIAAK